jgi:hypothetical protein
MEEIAYNIRKKFYNIWHWAFSMKIYTVGINFLSQ